MNSTSLPMLALDSRRGWPDEFRFLLDAYPREVWAGHANLGQIARFWLARHDGLRRSSRALVAAARQMKEGGIPAPAFRAWLAPRLPAFLGELEGHHSIEAFHYFPVFAAAEKRLARGFEVLETDHEAIHADLVALDEAGAAFAGALAGNGDLAGAGAGLTERLEGLLVRLDRHLGDEEDLIVPLILDRTEGALGIG